MVLPAEKRNCGDNFSGGGGGGGGGSRGGSSALHELPLAPHLRAERAHVVGAGDRGSRAGGFAALVATPLEAAEEGRRARRRCGRGR